MKLISRLFETTDYLQVLGSPPKKNVFLYTNIFLYNNGIWVSSSLWIFWCACLTVYWLFNTYWYMLLDDLCVIMLIYIIRDVFNVFKQTYWKKYSFNFRTRQMQVRCFLLCSVLVSHCPRLEHPEPFPLLLFKFFLNISRFNQLAVLRYTLPFQKSLIFFHAFATYSKL